MSLYSRFLLLGRGKSAASPGFKPARGTKYIDFMRKLHATCLFESYLEIGCRRGTTFAPSRSLTLAVDPFFRVETNVIGAKPGLFVFQQTSDDFFASGFLERNGMAVSVAFIDGMHLVEYALRDFINIERHAKAESVVLVHDCVPYTHEMTTRDLETRAKGAWTGDVWKLIPILQRYRPDLTLTVLDAKPTGLLAISGLKPGDERLAKASDEILAEFQQVTLADYGVKRFADSFDLTSTADEMAAGFPLFAKIRLDETLALKPSFVSP